MSLALPHHYLGMLCVGGEAKGRAREAGSVYVPRIIVFSARLNGWTPPSTYITVTHTRARFTPTNTVLLLVFQLFFGWRCVWGDAFWNFEIFIKVYDCMTSCQKLHIQHTIKLRCVRRTFS